MSVVHIFGLVVKLLATSEFKRLTSENIIFNFQVRRVQLLFNAKEFKKSQEMTRKKIINGLDVL